MSASFGFDRSSGTARGRWVVVAPWENAVVLRDGVLTGVMGPGRYRRKRRSDWILLDSRPRLLTIPTQEVLTADGVQVRLSLLASVSIVEPKTWVLASASPFESIYAALQVALRNRVADLELGAISGSRSTLLEGVDAEISPIAAAVGAEISGVTLKDITLPMEVRQAIAETAFAKQRGLADLERARSEAAALRSLANTAKLLADNPALMELRTLQAASEGAQVIIHRDGVTRQD